MVTFRIEREKKIVELMIRLYCRKKEGHQVLCAECETLLKYACERLEHCPFGEGKKSCKHCKIHCYKSEMRKHIQEIMRFSGPRMVIYYPGIALSHLFRR